jgi:hypothetical protein
MAFGVSVVSLFILPSWNALPAESGHPEAQTVTLLDDDQGPLLCLFY